ncbi:MAG TPA: MBL fold metallo-hydrolase [Clostridia bacterium]|nr:MBL fold metallo-hydrolase [Clostridia bacterium]
MLRQKKQLTIFLIFLFILQLLAGCSGEGVDFNLEPTLEEITWEVLNDLGETKEGASDTEESESATVGQLKVHFLDVGQADSILVQSREHFMLIDAGNNNDAEFIVKYLKDQGVTKLDYVIGTHPHEDHIGSLDVVIDTFEIGKVFMPKVTHTTKTFEDVLLAIQNKSLKINSPEPGSVFVLGDAEFTILAPNSKSYKDLNNYSLVIKLVHGKNSFLFTGDAEDVSEKEILEAGWDVVSDVLKVGHHGSSSSTTSVFLNEVNPTYAVISLGEGNDYGHPHKETLAKLTKKGVKIFRTDQQGTIIASSDGQTLKFKTTLDDK